MLHDISVAAIRALGHWSLVSLIRRVFEAFLQSTAIFGLLQKKHTPSVREVWGSIPGSVKSDAVLPTARHRSVFLWSCVARALNRGHEPSTRFTLQRNNASIIKIVFFAYIFNQNEYVKTIMDSGRTKGTKVRYKVL